MSEFLWADESYLTSSHSSHLTSGMSRVDVYLHTWLDGNHLKRQETKALPTIGQ